ncbi:MAG TPA: hypothetical protein VEO54_31905 [Thermoanaerobaculia bacterium]|nr:hypothetical protein [Thermoanaerobaculia bacterium]
MTALTIAFVGQCHTVGYPGVPPDAAFPEVCRADIQASRPERDVRVHLQPYYHPSELSGAVREALARQPRVVVIEVVGWLAVVGTRAVDLSRLPSGVRSAYERVRHFRHVSHAVARGVPRGAELIYTKLAGSILKPLLPRYPRPDVAEYESAVGQALELVRDAPGVDAVLQGPGAPNLDLDARGIATDAVARYRDVREMAQRAAASQGVLFVDRWDTVTGAFFTDNSVRPTAAGHSVWGHLLAAELLRAGLV